jgi:FtsX-like permease family
MFRFGLRMSLRGGREAATRLALTTLAVAIGVALLLCVLADFHAYQASSNRSCWECTGTTGPGGPAPSTAPPATPRAELWNYSADYYQGQTIERLDVAALGPGAPVPPGVSRLPGAGQYYASPALAALLRTVPADELGDRFGGTLAGTIGDAALSGPDELVIYVGYTPARLVATPGTIKISSITTSPPQQVFSPYFRYAFAVGVLAVLFPILILISTATRLSAARREERYAAMRLVGATPRQVSVIASVDAALGALAGTVLGIGIFALVRPALADASFIGTRYFAGTVTPTAAVYAGLLVAVPVVAAVASLLSLRRVQISPLGVSRKTSPPPPSYWRLAPLLTGIGLFVAGLAVTTRQSIGAAAFPGLLVIMIGLVVAGPWLTAQAARLVSLFTREPSSLLATRRLADNPKGAFRAVRGLVLAVFLGTIVAALAPAVNGIIATPNAKTLSNVLLDAFASPGGGGGGGEVCDGPGCPAPAPAPGAAAQAAQLALAEGLPPAVGARLVSELRAFPGTTVFPIYSMPQVANPNYQGNNIAIVSCATMRQLGVLGQCAPGVRAVQANDQNLFSDNPYFSTRAFVDASNPPSSAAFSRLYLQTVLVKVSDAATLEQVRTYLDTHTPPSPTGSPARTFGELVQIRSARLALAQRLVYIAVALTLLVAGCSLAVAVGGGLVERKRPFTLLRVSGTSVGTLYKVVFLEAVLPLAAATLVAAGVAYGISVLMVARMAPKGTAMPALSHLYYIIMGAGLAISLAVILVTLPLLRRMTGPASMRFE